jgi:hypothetical protein
MAFTAEHCVTAGDQTAFVRCIGEISYMYVVCTFVRFPPSLPPRLPFLCRHRIAAAKYDDFLVIVVDLPSAANGSSKEEERPGLSLRSLQLPPQRRRDEDREWLDASLSAHSFVGITSAGLLSPLSVARTAIICHCSISLLLGKR